MSPRDGHGHGTHTASTAVGWRVRAAGHGDGRLGGLQGVPERGVPQTVQNAVPWVITVAAATIDGAFPTAISLGNSEKLVGQSLYYHDVAMTANGSDFEMLIDGHSCSETALASVNTTGKVVLCSAPTASPPAHAVFGTILRVVGGGGRGLIFAQHTTNMLELLDACEGYMPCVLVDYEVARRISSYAGSTGSPAGAADTRRRDRGRRRGALAEGRRVLVEGPQSAVPRRTEASVTDRFGVPIQAEGVPRKLADPFDLGGGHIDPERAADPGLGVHQVLQLHPRPKDACGSYAGEPLYQLNLPSVAVPDLKGSVTVRRTVADVGPRRRKNATYRAVIEAPAGVAMSVEPPVITFSGGGRSVMFRVTLARVQGVCTFGSLTWVDDCNHSVRIPVAVRTVGQ
ncbi:subtilisin-like protease SBT3.3 [Panicum miliaceum]|uniref:Subtilisin-like protease SBT3.3 n=1 Tax=Panicum miliaceum TaxID=4540 RepID=A0A3L6PLM9_PANMI|nr:subtilisin-like protease SBT3.3 [Panicum miliaceum]